MSSNLYICIILLNEIGKQFEQLTYLVRVAHHISIKNIVRVLIPNIY